MQSCHPLTRIHIELILPHVLDLDSKGLQLQLTLKYQAFHYFQQSPSWFLGLGPLLEYPHDVSRSWKQNGQLSARLHDCISGRAFRSRFFESYFHQSFICFFVVTGSLSLEIWVLMLQDAWLRLRQESLISQSNMVRLGFSGLPFVRILILCSAPLLYLYSKDPYRPSDIGTQLVHTTPKHNLAALSAGSVPSPLTLDNLDQLNALGNRGSDIFLTSNDDVSQNPPWLLGVTPDSEGKVHNAKTCVIVVAEKGNGIVDVFYFYFYAYNWGGIVLDQNLGELRFYLLSPTPVA